ncbi:AAA family ATPase [Singulisphaera sp. PoT]|uniref:AAA family ATPase n=1 Tax=Singulisphaera sp. PoT TaxID=3411797 RepID=UPI003BF4A04A
MKFRVRSLELAFRKEDVVIPFSGVSYFWGQMGAGKTSIALMIDYCLGGKIELTPAMQSEFVSATLRLELEEGLLVIERPRDSDRVVASWGEGEAAYQCSLPARAAEGEIIPNTGVENLSDLIFWRSGVVPPKVRTSKAREESDLRRLSIRDLLWYCYLDQDNMDSSFFHLEEGRDPFRKLKSRDVIRYVIGFHDEKVAELEAQLDRLRGERAALQSSLAGIDKALKGVGVESQDQIEKKVEGIRAKAAEIAEEIKAVRQQVSSNATDHALEILRLASKELGDKLDQVEAAISNLGESLDGDRRHLNELETLSVKFKRVRSARAVLSGVEFQACPRCSQLLPKRSTDSCSVCGQDDRVATPDPTEEAVVDRDAKNRMAELREIIERHENSLERLHRERTDILNRKSRVERERNEASAENDSAYLSKYLAKERERAALLQEADSLARLVTLAKAVARQREEITAIEVRMATYREQLKAAKLEAESDSQNIERLKQLYLDCLLRSKLAGFKPDDIVQISTNSFFPEIRSSDEGDNRITSFATISSGGKKNLLKACFAVAIHRLAAQLKAPLPEFLMIDSAMKNISERENRLNFEGFYRLLYELKTDELEATQMIFIDKEFVPPPADIEVDIISRQMRPLEQDGELDPSAVPLIPYYSGK